jgi:hypothetical protein
MTPGPRIALLEVPSKPGSEDCAGIAPLGEAGAAVNDVKRRSRFGQQRVELCMGGGNTILEA